MKPANPLIGRLLDLRVRFVRMMPDRIAAIQAALADCADGGTEAMLRLEQQFHSLAGTAGTYNLNTVAAAAFEGEEACAEVARSPLDGDSYKYLTFLVDQLHGALAADRPATLG